MARSELDMRSVFNIPELEQVQDALAESTGLAIISIDYKGIPVTKHSRRTDFCSVIRENPVSRKRCYKCDSLAGLEAVRLNRPFIYLCHCGIVDAAIPVTVGERYLGAVMLGEVRLVSEDSSKVERLISEISSFQPDNCDSRHDLMELYKELPVMDYDTVERIVNMVAAFVNYTVSQAVKNHSEQLGYEYMLRREDMPSPLPRVRDDADIQELHSLRSAAPLKEEEDEELTVKRSSPVYPAAVYVENHRGEMIAMREMANLCHLSPSYFSKLFYREAGENFTNYVNRRKICWAKKLLRESSDSISAIAVELGFMDVSYFVKVFKKFEGITPLSYRQHNYR